MLIEPAMSCNFQSDRNKVMALHALYLAQDSTILSSTAKSITIKCCIKVNLSVSLKFKQLDPLLDTCGLDSKCIKEVLSEVKRWEHVPNHREPVTVKMVLHVHKKCKNKHPDSLESIPYDLIVLGILHGFRLSEWAQTPRIRPSPLQARTAYLLPSVSPT